MPTVVERTYRLGGIAFRVEADFSWVDFPPRHFEQFAAPGAQADVICRMRRIEFAVPPDDRSDPPTDPARLAAGAPSPLADAPEVQATLRVCQEHAEEVTFAFNEARGVICDFHCRTMDMYYRAGTASATDHRYLGAGLFGAFMPLYSAALLHGSCVVRSGKAALFVASDGGGKTTAATLSPTGTILCDDQNIVRHQQESLWVYGTPWGRHVTGGQRARLGGLFLLEKAPSFELIPLRPIEALPVLWQEHQGYFELAPNRVRLAAVALLQRLCRETPIHRLRFPIDGIDWEAVDRVLSAAVPPDLCGIP